MNTSYSISELNLKIHVYINELFENDIQVIGEVSGYKESNGNVYLTLKDEKSRISGVIWKSVMARNNINIKNGDKVEVVGKISTYTKTGQYQLYINKITISGNGHGLIQQEYDKLKKKLEKKGYFEQKNKQQMPKYIENIGIITAKTGAALQDVLYALKSSNFIGNIHVKNCSVQGVKCPETVC